MTNLKIYIALALSAVGAFFAAMAKARHTGRKTERNKAKEADRAQADQIRARVDSVDRTTGVRPDDKRGYRD